MDLHDGQLVEECHDPRISEWLFQHFFERQLIMFSGRLTSCLYVVYKLKSHISIRHFYIRAIVWSFSTIPASGLSIWSGNSWPILCFGCISCLSYPANPYLDQTFLYMSNCLILFNDCWALIYSSDGNFPIIMKTMVFLPLAQMQESTTGSDIFIYKRLSDQFQRLQPLASPVFR